MPLLAQPLSLLRTDGMFGPSRMFNLPSLPWAALPRDWKLPPRYVREKAVSSSPLEPL